MRISAKVLLLLGNAALGLMLLTVGPPAAAAEPWPNGCCKHDTSGNGVCCIDCCTSIRGCISSSACPKLPKT